MNSKPVELKICISKPNGINYSETFIDSQIKFLPGDKYVVYGGFFPLFSHKNAYLIESRFDLIIYLIAKRVLRKKEIGVRTRAFSTYLKRNQIDVVLAEYGITGALIRESCEAAGIPLVIHFHGFDAHVQRTVKEYALLYRNSFAYASAIVAVSRHMQDSLIKLGAPAEKVVYIPYGVDTLLFARAIPSANPLVFLSVARFAEKKSPLSTLAAFKLVKDRYPEARLLMAGIGPLWEKAKETAILLGIKEAVSFLGVQNPEQVAGLMRNAAVFVQHSVTAAGGDSEGTPNSILEAAASGLPVVSTFHAGIPEAVINGKTGFLVKEHDIEGMAAYMCKLASDSALADEMGAAGRSHIELNYNMPVQIGRLSAVLKKAYAQHTNPINNKK